MICLSFDASLSTPSQGFQMQVWPNVYPKSWSISTGEWGCQALQWWHGEVAAIQAMCTVDNVRAKSVCGVDHCSWK